MYKLKYDYIRTKEYKPFREPPMAFDLIIENYIDSLINKELINKIMEKKE